MSLQAGSLWHLLVCTPMGVNNSYYAHIGNDFFSGCLLYIWNGFSRASRGDMGHWIGRTSMTNKEERWNCLSCLKTVWCHGISSTSVVLSPGFKFPMCNLLTWPQHITVLLSIHSWENLSGVCWGPALMYAKCWTLNMSMLITLYFLGYLWSQSELNTP